MILCGAETPADFRDDGYYTQDGTYIPYRSADRRLNRYAFVAFGGQNDHDELIPLVKHTISLFGGNGTWLTVLFSIPREVTASSLEKVKRFDRSRAEKVRGAGWDIQEVSDIHIVTMGTGANEFHEISSVLSSRMSPVRLLLGASLSTHELRETPLGTDMLSMVRYGFTPSDATLDYLSSGGMGLATFPTDGGDHPALELLIPQTLDIDALIATKMIDRVVGWRKAWMFPPGNSILTALPDEPRGGMQQ